MPRRCFHICSGLLGLTLIAVVPGNASAAWPTDPLANVPVCIATGQQVNPVIISDGAGGAIVTWQDTRSGLTNPNDIYVQRVLAGGVLDPAWPSDGRALCTAVGDQYTPAIISDGEGGAIVTWVDQRGGSRDIYAQHVLVSGVVDPAWPIDGRAVCIAAGDQEGPNLAPDGSGGAIITWQDGRSGFSHIYAQRVLATGAVDPDWPTDGRAVCTGAGTQLAPRIISDGTGGAIIAWSDWRGGSTDSNIYAQHVLTNGVADPAWPADGRAICTAVGDQQAPSLVADGSGGGIVTWGDARSDSSSGGYVIWDIYAHHVLAGGALDTAWPHDGRVLCVAAGIYSGASVVTDGEGGAIAAWQDNRNGPYDVHLDIYAQRVLASGIVNPDWPANGRVICAAAGGQQWPKVIPDGTGGAIVTWHDERGVTADVYSQRVQANGQLGGDVVGVASEVSQALALDPLRPNPSRVGMLRVHFTLSSAATAYVELIDLAGRRIASREVGSLGPGRHSLDLGTGVRLPTGLYFVRLKQGTIARVQRVTLLE